MRELTPEEKALDITFERFSNYHHDAGEDFVDQFGGIPIQEFGPFCIERFPELTEEITEIMGDKYGEALVIEHAFEEYFENGTNEAYDVANQKFYTILADFINTKVDLKAEVNEELIGVDEHYNK
jgi:hypothetical protein